MRFTQPRLSIPLEISRKRLQATTTRTLIDGIKAGGGALIIATALAACGGGGGGGGGADAAASAGSGTTGTVPGITQTATGVASLSWDLPLTTAGGKPLRMSDLAGYRVYTGTAPYNLQPVATINDAGTGEYTVTGLTPGIHYFAVTAVDAEGGESAFSSVESKRVN